MASQIHPFVPVTLDKERHLCFGAAAFIEYKDATGDDLMKAIRTLSKKFEDFKETEEFPFKDVRDILWAALIHEDPDLTRREVSNLFDLQGMTDLVPKLMEAFILAMPKANGAVPHPAPAKQKRSTGA